MKEDWQATKFDLQEVDSLRRGVQMYAVPGGYSDDNVRISVRISPSPAKGAPLRLLLPMWPAEVDARLGNQNLLFEIRIEGTSIGTIQPTRVRLSDTAIRQDLGAAWRRLISPDIDTKGDHLIWWNTLDEVIGETGFMSKSMGSRPMRTYRDISATGSVLDRALGLHFRLQARLNDVSPAEANEVLDALMLEESGQDTALNGTSSEVRKALLYDVMQEAAGARPRQPGILSQDFISAQEQAGKPAIELVGIAQRILEQISVRDVKNASVPKMSVLREASKEYHSLRNYGDLAHQFLLQGQGTDKPEPIEHGPGLIKRTTALKRRLFAAMGDPCLGRLFNFIIDYEVSADGLRNMLGGMEGETKFIAIRPIVLPENQPIGPWSLARFRYSESGSGVFWARTRDDNDANVDVRKLQQVEGILNLGLVSEGRRFELHTVDTVASIEMEKLAKDAGYGSNSRQTQRTGGLSIVHSNAATEVSARYSARLSAASMADEAFIDAATATDGYLVDIRYDEGDWRPLGYRSVSLSNFLVPQKPEPNADQTPSKVLPFETLLADLGLEKNSERRLTVNAVSAKTGTCVNSSTGSASSSAEELLMVWQGDPIGFEGRYHKQEIYTHTDLAIGQRVEPLKDLKYLPWKLRFGRKYQVGLRPVVSGSGAIPLSEAKQLYEQYGTYTLPSKSFSGIRMLRHERIEAPMAAIPAWRIRPMRDSGFDLDSSGALVVRSIIKRNETSETVVNKSSSIVLTAPTVTLEFASFHGVFDRLRSVDLVRNGRRYVRKAFDADNKNYRFESVKSAPPDGLRNVNFNAIPGGGFPSLAKDGKKLFLFNFTTDKGSADEKIKLAEIKGDAVFAFDSVAGASDAAVRRSQPYYPDPAAQVLCLGFKHRLGSKDWLKGDTIVVDLYHGLHYPNARAVLIEITARPRRNNIEPTHQNLLHAIRYGSIDSGGRFTEHEFLQQGRIAAAHVELHLAPGEDFTLVAWHAPRAAIPRGKDAESDLWRWFNALESLAAGFVYNKPNPDQAMIESIYQSYPQAKKTFDDLLTEYDAIDPPAQTDKRCAWVANIALPRDNILKAFGEIFGTELRKKPLSELSATREIRLVHALSCPLTNADFRRNKGTIQLPAVIRRNFGGTEGENAEQQRRKFLELYPSSRWHQSDGPKNEEAATDVLVGGSILADIDTSHAFQIICNAPSPNSAIFDDPKLGVPALDWQRPNPVTDKYPFEGLSGDDFKKEALARFGFEVDDQGWASFPRPEFNLLEFAADPVVSTWNPRYGERDELDIAMVPGGPRDIRKRHVFTDTVARRLEVRVRAHGRFTEFFRQSNGTDLEGIKRHLDTPTVSIWVPATKRPTPLTVQTLLPCFSWTKVAPASGLDGGLRREVFIRIRVDRPYPVSGEGERFGIVLWPLREPKKAGQPPETIAIPFDQIAGQLRRAAQYVSVWGADPIHDNDAPEQGLVPAEAFPDWKIGSQDKPYDSKECKFVESVQMPIPAGEQGEQTEPILVSLLTYRPRFDVTTEDWYFDVAIDPRDIQDPILRLAIVRYQENAIEGHQVSEPITREIAIAPARIASVSTDRQANGRYKITVNLRGRFSTDAAPLDPSDGSETVESSKRKVPKVTFRLMGPDTLARTPCELVLEEVLDPAAPTPVGDGQSQWRHSFAYEASKQEIDEGALAVLVDERNLMLPTSGKGLTPGAQPALKATNARFACRVPISA